MESNLFPNIWPSKAYISTTMQLNLNIHAMLPSNGYQEHHSKWLRPPRISIVTKPTLIRLWLNVWIIHTYSSFYAMRRGNRNFLVGTRMRSSAVVDEAVVLPLRSTLLCEQSRQVMRIWLSWPRMQLDKCQFIPVLPVVQSKLTCDSKVEGHLRNCKPEFRNNCQSNNCIFLPVSQLEQQ